MGSCSTDSGRGEITSQIPILPDFQNSGPSNNDKPKPKATRHERRVANCYRFHGLRLAALSESLPASRSTPSVLMRRVLDVMKRPQLKADGCTQANLITLLTMMSRKHVDVDNWKVVLNKAVKEGKLECFRRRYKLPQNNHRRRRVAKIPNMLPAAPDQPLVCDNNKTCTRSSVRVRGGPSKILIRSANSKATKIKLSAKAKPAVASPKKNDPPVER